MFFMADNEQENKFVYSEECDSLLEDALKTEGISETLQKFFYIISLITKGIIIY